MDIMSAPLVKVSSLMGEITLHYSKHQAQNAYCACILFPQLHQLRFETVLRPHKVTWSKSLPRYAVYYDAFESFCALMKCFPYKPDNITAMHLRVNSLMPFLYLFCSMDLAQMHPGVAMQGN